MPSKTLKVTSLIITIIITTNFYLLNSFSVREVFTTDKEVLSNCMFSLYLHSILVAITYYNCNRHPSDEKGDNCMFMHPRKCYKKS